IVNLSEENFFKPVYDWHQDRGLIFGCDHGGRGRDVAEFGDYFRTQRWNQGPGSDQPFLSKDIIKAKVAASISHLYERPRVWLEGFHSSGWGTSSADVTDAIFANFVAGYNLLSFHGLYYSTKGGWWEWAPPDNHFRMPYWQQMGPLMNCVERLSYLLSQGVHLCDIAVIYPVEPVIAGMDGDKSVNTAFQVGEQLYDQGIDFDFIDFESLARSVVTDKEIHISGEKYKVLVIPSMKAIRFESLQKIEEFKNAGGIVLNIGDRPEATEKKGTNDPDVVKLVNSIFSKNGNLVQVADAESVVSAISGKYVPNFKILTEINARPYAMHRAIGKREIYALYNFPSESRCFFYSKGKPELWNPWNGEIVSLANFAKETGDGTEITLPLSEKEIQIIVFESGTPAQADSMETLSLSKLIRQTDLGNNWEFELNPSMDNQWGDFQLPASNELMGAQVRQFYYTENKEYRVERFNLDDNWKLVSYGYGTQFLKLGALPVLPSEEDLLKMIPEKEGAEVQISGKSFQWEEYGFSWKSGVEGDYGHQGYHGLKGEMYDNFIRLGALGEEKHSKFRKSESEGNFYVLYSTVIAPNEGDFELLIGDEEPLLLFVNGKKTNVNEASIRLKKGANPILMVYNKACETYLSFRKPNATLPAKQQVSMRWYGDAGVLPFDWKGSDKSSGLFAFKSAPALLSLSFSAYGKVSVWADGIPQEVTGKILSDELTEYSVKLKSVKSETSQIVLKIDYSPGFRGAGAITKYISQQCGMGIIALGDWSEIDGLRSYSGGAWYRKTIEIKPDDLNNKLEIDLGDLVSSAELFVNGKSAGIKLAPPWKFDITKLAQLGENNIEVLIYNTLANNFITTPTRYRGSIKSGLIGPVFLNVSQ
ncbi:MAG TPA: glycosyl hydrolase, partial [Draconibacterium sp.]|nr:glycosyl hydrolase [Draconibacterium sp.]